MAYRNLKTPPESPSRTASRRRFRRLPGPNRHPSIVRRPPPPSTMPELPEVEAIRRHLASTLTNMSIDRASVRRRDVIRDLGGRRRGRLHPADLGVGRRVEMVDRRGKQLIVRLEDGIGIVIRLGMSGRLELHPRGSRSTSPHRHVVWMLRGAGTSPETRLDFIDPRRFGGVHLAQSPSDLEERLLAGLGPEAHTIAPETLYDRLRRTSRSIKTAMLDQSVIAGVGNIYADEVLFAAGVHPNQPANTISRPQVKRLADALRVILQKAIEQGGSTIQSHTLPDGGVGNFASHHKVYGRGGLPCTRCGDSLDRVVLGGRSTTFCATCQGVHPHG